MVKQIEVKDEEADEIVSTDEVCGYFVGNQGYMKSNGIPVSSFSYNNSVKSIISCKE